ncbi:MAG: hypothetical protein FJ387_07940 [Verrucomicrobia bacterium]|nr:hypothetical protein [Verrucomicrobiota bacterium]
MSLKAFHILFILVSIVLAFGFGAWELVAFFDGRQTLDLALGAGSLVAGVALIFYFRAVLKKLKNMSYL